MMLILCFKLFTMTFDVSVEFTEIYFLLGKRKFCKFLFLWKPYLFLLLFITFFSCSIEASIFSFERESWVEHKHKFHLHCIIVDINIFWKNKKWELRGPPFLEYTPVGVHHWCSTLDLFKKLGGILTSYNKVDARFVVLLTLVNLLYFLQISRVKNVCEYMLTPLSPQNNSGWRFLFPFEFDWRFGKYTSAHGSHQASEK